MGRPVRRNRKAAHKVPAGRRRRREPYRVRTEIKPNDAGAGAGEPGCAGTRPNAGGDDNYEHNCHAAGRIDTSPTGGARRALKKRPDGGTGTGDRRVQSRPCRFCLPQRQAATRLRLAASRKGAVARRKWPHPRVSRWTRLGPGRVHLPSPACTWPPSIS